MVNLEQPLPLCSGEEAETKAFPLRLSRSVGDRETKPGRPSGLAGVQGWPAVGLSVSPYRCEGLSSFVPPLSAVIAQSCLCSTCENVVSCPVSELFMDGA